MPKRKPKDSNLKFPPKQIIRDGQILDFNRDDPELHSGIYQYSDGEYGKPNQRLAVYPSVYSIEIPGHGYTKTYDYFSDLYLENMGFINWQQYNLYNYIATLRNRGYRLSIHGARRKRKPGDPPPEPDAAQHKGLAAFSGVSPKTLITDLDHLEDCLLMHRVRRLDLQGIPSDLVIHSPFTPTKFEEMRKVIVKRISTKYTRTRRLKMMMPTAATNILEDDRADQKFYFNRKAGEPRFQLSAAVREAYGPKFGHFVNFALEFFNKYLWEFRNQQPQFEKGYRDALKIKLTYWGIADRHDREKCYQAAAIFRNVYCPTLADLCGD